MFLIKCVSIFVLISTLFLLKLQATQFCPNTCDCIDELGDEDIKMTCPKEPHQQEFEIKILNWTNIHIECNIANEIDNYLHLPVLNLSSIQWIRFMRCKFHENVTFSDILNQLQITHSNALKFNNFNMKEINILNENMFINLNNLKILEIIASMNLSHYLHINIFKNLSELNQLNLHNNNLKQIPENMFQTLNQLQFLDLSKNDLSKLPNIRQLSMLKVLNFWSNNITQIDPDMFDKLLNLQRLNLQKNKIKHLNAEIFTNLHNLIDLSLSMNDLTELSESIFVHNQELRYISLAHNNLTILPDSIFRNQNKLVTLFLNNCDLKNLSNNLFRNLKQLRTLYLHNNQIQIITNELFSDLIELDTLHMYNNKIKIIESNAFHKTIKLKYINLNQNEITPFKSPNQPSESKSYSSPFATLKNLEELHLAKNFLNQLYVDWKTLIHLQRLDLSWNNFTYLEFPSVLMLCSNAIVDLRHNQINVVNFKNVDHYGKAMLKQYYYRPNYILLEHNPIRCDCHNYDFIRFIRNEIGNNKVHSKMKFETEDLVCSTPKQLQGQKLTKVDTKLINCKYISEQNPCPDKCQCSYHNWDNTFLIDCSNQNFTIFPNLTTFVLNEQFSIALNLSNNNLNKIIFNSSFSNQISKLFLSNNNLTSIEFYNAMEKLEILELNTNQLRTINVTMLSKIKTLKNLTLYNNPWNCDCNNLHFILFVQQYYKSMIRHNLFCTQKPAQNLLTLTPNDLCPLNIFIFVGIMFSLIFICLLMGLIIVYYRHKLEIKVWLYAHNIYIPCLGRYHENDSEKIFDAFVSFSQKDHKFIEEQLIPNLEQNDEKRFSLCIHYRDWVPGEWIPNQIVYSIENSHRTIVVLSKNFLESVWGKMEFRAAHLSSLQNRQQRLIIIKLDDIGPIEKLDDELRAYLTMNTYIEWGQKSFWDKLRYALPHRMILSNQGHILSNVIAKSLNQSKLEMKQVNENKISV